MSDTKQELPEWLPKEAWFGYIAMRKQIKKPATDYAIKLAIALLDTKRLAGADVEAILNDWTKKIDPTVKQELTAVLLKKHLHYTPGTGDFLRLISSAPNKDYQVGKIAQVLNKDGYYQVGFASHCQPAHRMAWLYVHGSMPEGHIDHIDGNPKNNRIANLRVVTNAENCQNRRHPTRKNKAGLLGVVACANGTFAAQIKRDYKSMHLGTFDTAEEAHAVYLEAKRKIHPFGEVAKKEVAHGNA